MSYIGTYGKQVGNAAAALPLGIFFEHFAELEEEHHTDGFNKFGFAFGHKSDGKCSKRCYAHQKMLVPHIAMSDAHKGFQQRFIARNEIGGQIDQELLSGG